MFVGSPSVFQQLCYLLVDTGIYFYQVALHELGHSLGIAHSANPSAVMAPYYQYNPNVQLTSDDIQAIQALYGCKYAAIEAQISCNACKIIFRNNVLIGRIYFSQCTHDMHS